VGLVTIAASTYMITYSQRLYAVFEPLLGVFERKGTPREPDEDGRHPLDGTEVIIFGLGRFGTAIGLRLRQRGIRVLGVDFNPRAVRRWHALGLDAEYGDATDPEFVAHLPLATARCAVSTVPVHTPGLASAEPRTALIQVLRASGFRGTVAVASHSDTDTADLQSAGADIVLEPFQDAADRAVDLLCGGERRARTAIPSIESEEAA